MKVDEDESTTFVLILCRISACAEAGSGPAGGRQSGRRHPPAALPAGKTSPPAGAEAAPLFTSLRAASPLPAQPRRWPPLVLPASLRRRRLPAAVAHHLLPAAVHAPAPPLRLPPRFVRFPQLYTRPLPPVRFPPRLVRRSRQSMRPLQPRRSLRLLVPRLRQSTRLLPPLRFPPRLGGAPGGIECAHATLAASRSSARASGSPRARAGRRGAAAPRRSSRLYARPRQPLRLPPRLVQFPQLSTRPRRRNCGPAESPACRPVRNRRAASAGHDEQR